MKADIKLTVNQLLDELHLTKDSSIQAIPLSNEAYVSFNTIGKVTRNETWKHVN